MHHRKTFTLFTLLITIFSIYSFYSCRKTNAGSEGADPFAALNIPTVPFNYANQALPGYLKTPLINGQDNTGTNTITDWGATLGRVLFYDKTLSINNTLACASCHKQNFSFADNAAFSTGFAGGLTARNSMQLVNARYYPGGKFFWDERAATLEAQTLMPIQHPVEMGMNLDTLVNRLKSKVYYPALFQKAFGNTTITTDKISAALAEFTRSIVSYQSKFDVGRATVNPPQDPILTPYPNFTPLENQGKQLFFSPLTNCGQCHGTETFTAPMIKNNGLENPSIDKGVGAISNLTTEVGDFKVASLKNIELTGPYMHDGRFATLDKVVEHYNSGVQPNSNLSVQLRDPTGAPRRLNLSDNQKASLVAFLKTLTDVSVTTDVKFSNPFK